MKTSKYLIILTVSIFSALMLLLACNSENSDKAADVVAAKEAAAFEQLFANIDLYDTSFFIENNIDATRGKADRAERRERRRAILSADAGGALLGAGIGALAGGGIVSLVLGIVSGVSSSIITAVALQDVSLTTQATAMSIPQTYAAGVLGDDYDEMGYLHNKIISDIFVEYGDEFIANADERTLFTIILQELEQNDYDVSGVKADLNANYLKVKSITDLLTAGDVDTFTARIAATYPQLAREVAVLDQYIDTYEMLPEDVALDYTAGFRKIVESAAISDSSKTIIRAGVSTAQGSGNLWAL